MAKKGGLGKGLDALFISDERAQTESENKVSALRIAQIEPNSDQPRKRFEPTQLAELASSIKEHGVIQPIVVIEGKGGFYKIIAGERRWRAAKLAGLTEIPAIVRDYDEQTASEIALIENLQRENLNPIEEADGYRSLMDLYGLTQEQISEKIGKSRSAVANALRLLTLKEPLRKLVSEGALSGGHARALLAVENDEERTALAERAVREQLSVREVERLAAAKKKEPVKKPVHYEAELRALEGSLSTKIGTRVKISGGAKKGKIEIEYYGNEDLERILEFFG